MGISICTALVPFSGVFPTDFSEGGESWLDEGSMFNTARLSEHAVGFSTASDLLIWWFFECSCYLHFDVWNTDLLPITSHTHTEGILDWNWAYGRIHFQGVKVLESFWGWIGSKMLGRVVDYLKIVPLPPPRSIVISIPPPPPLSSMKPWPLPPPVPIHHPLIFPKLISQELILPLMVSSQSDFTP